MDIKDSYLHGTVGVVKSISVAADKLSYKLADVAGTTKTVTMPTATQSANGLLSSTDKKKLDSITGPTLSIPYIVGPDTDTTAGTWTGSYSGITTYTDGLTIIYVPKVAGASTTTLNINGLGAKTCYYNNALKLTTHYAVGTPILFTYSGGAWKRADYNADTNTQIRIYRQNTGYNADYPLIVSRTAASSIGTSDTNGSYTVVYGVMWNDTTKVPTLNPSTGEIKAVKFTGALNGTANKVANNLILKIKSGSTENTDLYTYNGSAAKTLDIKQGTGITLTAAANALTITNAGVRSIATGTTNGTISVNTNGTSANVAVKGLGSAAYTASTDYAVRKTLSDEDLNNVIIPGFYNAGGGNTVTNKPSAVTHFGLEVIHGAAGSYYVQILYQNSYSNSVWRRHCQNGTWSDWTKDTFYRVVSSSDNGLAPKVISTNTATVGSAYYVLASTNGSATPSWYKLPATAFANDDTKVTQTNTTGSALYRVLLSGNANDTTETTTARKSSKLLFNPSTGNLIATTFQGNLDGTYVNKLTNYEIATTIGSITTTDSLNIALGKLEFKTNFIYNDLFGTDNDDVINKWHEIVDFIDSVKEDTDITDEFVTRKTALTITGEKTFTNKITIKTTSANKTPKVVFDEYYNSSNPSWISEIASDYYGTNICETTGFTHGFYITLGRSGFDNLIILNSSKNPIARISKNLGHWFDGDITVQGSLTATNNIFATGGTLSLVNIDSFVIKKTSNTIALIAFLGRTSDSDTTNIKYGYLGINGKNNPVFGEINGEGTTIAYYRTLLHSGNYNSYLPFLNSSSTHATNSSVIYAPITAGTKNLVLISNGSGAPVWTNLSNLSVGYATNWSRSVNWQASTTVGSWSRILTIQNYANILLSTNWSLNSQASQHLYLICVGYDIAKIVQLGYNGYPIHSAIQIRVIKESSLKFHVEVYNSYGYDGATTISIGCRATNIGTLATLTTISTNTVGSGTAVASLTSSYYRALNLHSEWSGNGLFYIAGTGDTAGTWLGSHSEIKSYYTGLTIAYKIPIAGASTTTLNINNLGAKTCYINTSKLTTHYGVGCVAILIYDGTYFRAADYWDGNSYAYVRQYTTDSADAEYPLLFRYNTAAPTANGYVTEYTRYDSGITINPSTNTITTPGIVKTGNLVITLTTAGKHILFSRGSDTDYPYNYIAAPVGGFICILPNGVANSSNNGMQFSSSGLHPGTDVAYSLGTSSLKWNAVYATNFHGALKGNADSASKLTTVSKTAWGLTYWTSEGVPTSISGDMTNVGNITIDTGNNDKFITFAYNNGTHLSWRIGYLGTGEGDTNYMVFLSNLGTSGGSYTNALRLGCTTLDAAFGGNVYPLVTNTKTLGTSSLKWKNVYATTFTGNLSGNATTATTANTLKATTIVSAKALSLSNAAWTDTGYTFASLATGTYAVQVTFGTTLVASGIMSVYKNLTDTAGDEIPLHVYGTETWRPYLRTYANKLLISSNDAAATSRTVTIKIALIL